MASHNPSQNIQDYQVFGEYGGVNPSISDSATFTFLNPETMVELFESGREGCYLYSRHWNPTNRTLATALAHMEGSESAHVTGSGMSAISNAIMQLCDTGDEIVSSRTVYGGTYALLKKFLPRFEITTHFVDITDLDAVRSAITERTRVLYTESLSNPLLHLADIPALAEIANKYGITLVVDNTFTPLIIAPIQLGAHVVVHSLTKYINGTSDGLGGCVCASEEFINSLMDVNTGASMLLGPVLDSHRAASIHKNLHSLPVRMRQHSQNAMQIACQLQKLGVKVHYPGLSDHPQHHLMMDVMNQDFGFGGMLVIDVDRKEVANHLMMRMQEEQVGYVAVSLGFYKTLFSAPGSSTSSEIPLGEQNAMGLSDGMIRMSIGLDHDIQITFERIRACLEEVGVIQPEHAI